MYPEKREKSRKKGVVAFQIKQAQDPETAIDVPKKQYLTHPMNIALKCILIYAFFGVLFGILLSDSVLEFLNLNKNFIQALKSHKIWLYLFLSAPILYWLIAHLSLSLHLYNQYLLGNEKKIIRVNRVCHLSREMSHAVLRIEDREQLLREACKIARHLGDFCFVFAGLSEMENVLPDILATEGQENNYLKHIFDTPMNKERAEPTLVALKKMQPVVINDLMIYEKKDKSAWQKSADANEFRAIGSFPFKTLAGRIGVFSFYSRIANVFSEEEIEILQRVVADIGYGLSNIEQKEKLYYAANFDAVTHLPNRPLLEDRLKQFIARAYYDKRYIGVASVMIVNLKQVIETKGQIAGDRLLQETAKHLVKLVRDGDTIGRFGKNELGVLLTDVAEQNDVAIVMEQLLRPFIVNLPSQNEVTVVLRAGVAIFPQDGDNAQILIKHANQTLVGIQDNINCDFYSKEMASDVRRNHVIAQEMKEALKHEEFYLYYQPIINIETRMISAVEVLTRWRSNKLGDISPAQFITIADDTNLIMPLGIWILSTACQQLMKWKKMGIDIAMTVNISAKQLTHPEFLEKLTALFNEIQFNPKEFSFGIEISENTLISTIKSATRILSPLREMGLKIYIDDFGTGSASLSYLHQLPVDVLKIDSMFVRTLNKDPNIKSLIKGILAFATGLGLKTVAEGVETEKQLHTLQRLGCHEAQGYLFSPPMLAKEIEPLFNHPL